MLATLPFAAFLLLIGINLGLNNEAKARIGVGPHTEIIFFNCAMAEISQKTCYYFRVSMFGAHDARF